LGRVVVLPDIFVNNEVIGHLPAGYVLSTIVCQRIRLPDKVRQLALMGGLIGSIAADFDLLYFYLVDNCQHIYYCCFLLTDCYTWYWIVLWVASIGLRHLISRPIHSGDDSAI
jgi:inner membrane protein